MGNEVHLYTLGMDPYVLTMGGLDFFIHQGHPTSQTAPVQPSTVPPGIYQPPELSGLYANYIVDPEITENLGGILAAQDQSAETINLGVALSTGGASNKATGDQLRAVLDEISQYDAGNASIHVVSLEGLERFGTDG